MNICEQLPMDVKMPTEEDVDRVSSPHKNALESDDPWLRSNENQTMIVTRR